MGYRKFAGEFRIGNGEFYNLRCLKIMNSLVECFYKVDYFCNLFACFFCFFFYTQGLLKVIFEIIYFVKFILTGRHGSMNTAAVLLYALTCCKLK